MREWAESLLSDIHHSSAILNYCHSEAGYSDALAAQRAKVKDSELTPSGRMLKEMEQNKQSFFEFSLERSKLTQKELLSSTLDKRTLKDFIGASNSLSRNRLKSKRAIHWTLTAISLTGTATKRFPQISISLLPAEKALDIGKILSGRRALRQALAANLLDSDQVG